MCNPHEVGMIMNFTKYTHQYSCLCHVHHQTSARKLYWTCHLIMAQYTLIIYHKSYKKQDHKTAWTACQIYQPALSYRVIYHALFVHGIPPALVSLKYIIIYFVKIHRSILDCQVSLFIIHRNRILTFVSI